jgi:hypothetical protein
VALCLRALQRGRVQSLDASSELVVCRGVVQAAES